MTTFLFFEFSPRDLIFSILLPVLFVYLTLYIFLKKARIFGDVSNYYYSITSMLISLISIFSIYSLGLIQLLPLILTFFILGAFLLVYLYGIYKHSERAVLAINQNLETLIAQIESLTKKYDEASGEEKIKIKEKLREKLSLVKEIGKKQGRNVENENWFIKAKKIVD